MSLLTVANYLGGIMGGVGTFCTAHRPHKGRQVAIATVFYGISCFWFGALLNFIVCSRTLPCQLLPIHSYECDRWVGVVAHGGCCDVLVWCQRCRWRYYAFHCCNADYARSSSRQGECQPTTLALCRCVWHKRGCCHPSLPVCIGLSARHYACGVVEFDVCVTGGAIGAPGTLGPLPCSQRGE